jgi:putative phosphoribosyl transferase
MIFADRADAGRALAAELEGLRGADVVVTGLPRGGVPVAAEVARALDAPLDVILVRKVGVPFHAELAMGAIGEDGVRVINAEVTRAAAVTPEEFLRVEARERSELVRRSRRYRAARPSVPLSGRTVVVVDDGIATGSTARAACQIARAHGARRVVLAVPVASSGSLASLADAADELVSVQAPESFMAVGQFYVDFSPVSDDEVVGLLLEANGPATSATPAGPAAPTTPAASGEDRPMRDDGAPGGRSPLGPVRPARP